MGFDKLLSSFQLYSLLSQIHVKRPIQRAPTFLARDKATRFQGSTASMQDSKREPAHRLEHFLDKPVVQQLVKIQNCLNGP